MAICAAAGLLIAGCASTSVGLLQATPAPIIAGGGDLQTNAVESFTAVSDVYSRGALTVPALTPTSVSDLKTAVDAIEAEATASIPNSMANVDPTGLSVATSAAARWSPRRFGCPRPAGEQGSGGYPDDP